AFGEPPVVRQGNRLPMADRRAIMSRERRHSTMYAQRTLIDDSLWQQNMRMHNAMKDESAASDSVFAANFDAVITEWTDAKRRTISEITAESKVTHQTIRRWRSCGLNKVTKGFREVCRILGYVPESFWNKTPKRIHPPPESHSDVHELLQQVLDKSPES